MKGSRQKYPQGNKQLKIATGYNEIHVFVQETSSLVLNKNEDIEARISVQAFGKIQYSKVLSKVGYQSRVWGEHFYFNKIFKNEQAEALQKSLIIIKAWDHKKILSSALIGEHELSVAKIYSLDNHVLNHTWLALSNVTKNHGQVAGMIKVSINVTNQNDNAQTLELEPYNAGQKDKNILMAANVLRKGHQLTVDIYEGNDLKPVAGETTDSYIGLEFGMIYERTKTVVNECNPQWNETLSIPVHIPAYVDNVILRLIDANVFKSKQVMGSCYIPLNELSSQKESRGIFATQRISKSRRYDEKLWVNFYGPQIEGENNQYKHQYSIYPDLAPYYTGSVLIKAVLQPNSNPKKEKAAIQVEEPSFSEQYDSDGEVKKKVKVDTKPYLSYKVYVKFELGMNLPTRFSSYAMSVRVGKFEAVSKMKRVKHGFAMWNTEKTIQVQFYENQNIPDIFFYLINEDEDKICYYRVPVNDRKEIKVENTWRKLKPDLTKIKIYQEEAGYVKFQMTLAPADKLVTKKTLKSIVAEHMKTEYDGQFSENGTYHSQIVMRIPCKIMIDLYCAQNLLAGDDDGSADPYFRFTFQESVKTSTVKPSTVNPVYIQRFILEGKMGDNDQIMPLTVTVFNKNAITDQAIGTCYINLYEHLTRRTILTNTNFNHSPQWFDIEIDGNSYGRFLAGITIIKTKLPLLNGIVFEEDDLETYEINLFVLGLRCLKSSNSIVSIRKPIIHFDFDSLYAYSAKERIREHINAMQQVDAVKPLEQQAKPSRNVKFQPDGPGSSVNIQKSQTIVIKLPKSQLYWPTLCARVSNSVIGDLYQPHIGYFYIDLKQAYTRTQKLKQEYNHQKEQLSNLNNKKEGLEIPNKLSGINQAVLSSLIIFVVKNVKYNWHEASKQTQKKLIRLIKTAEQLQKRSESQLQQKKKLDDNYIVVMPSYRFDEEKNAYVEQYKQVFERNREYIKIGYDNKNSLKKSKENRNRHYRYCLDKPYEHYYKEINGIEFGVFSQIPIKKGRTFLPQQKNILNNSIFNSEQTEVGFYKGNCLIIEKSQVDDEVSMQFKKDKQNQLTSFLKGEKIRMYLYVVNAFSIPSKKAGTLPNPYLVVKLGEKDVKNFYEEKEEKSAAPEFNFLIKKDLEFPENSEIIIQLWDRGMIQAADELIGQAVIYAQNRVFYQFGRMKFNNPVETHPLKVMQSRQQQGKVRFWVDFVPLNFLSLYKQFDISSSASTEFEVRVIIWGCSDVRASQHDATDMVDLYVTCGFNGELKETDVHYRTQSGDGSFNWRMIFPLRVPIIDSTLTFKVYDKGLVGKDMYLATGELNIGSFIQQAYDNEIEVKLFEGVEDMKKQANLPCQVKKDKSGYRFSYDIFNVNLINKGDGDVGNVDAAKVMISVQILPKVEAEKKKAGQGRSEPNEYPNLPDPTGRLQFSLNPVTMATRLCGKRFKNKIMLAILCFLFGTCCIYFFPSILGSFLAKSISA